MPEVELKPRAVARPVGRWSLLFWARAARVSQFIVTIVALVLCARTCEFYEAPSEAAYSTAVSAISLFYLLAVSIGTIYARQHFMVGLVLFSEIILMILWLVAFILMAVFSAGINCSSVFYESRCQESQAAIAMCACSMVLYAFTLALFIMNCVKPVRSLGSIYLW